MLYEEYNRAEAIEKREQEQIDGEGGPSESAKFLKQLQSDKEEHNQEIVNEFGLAGKIVD